MSNIQQLVPGSVMPQLSSSAMRLRLKRYDNQTMANSFGFGFTIIDRGSPPVLLVESLAPECDAERSGLVRPGDIILRINNVDVSRCTYDEAVQTLASTPIGSYASFIVRAPYGFNTRLVTTFDEDGTPRTHRITERSGRKQSIVPLMSPSMNASPTRINHRTNMLNNIGSGDGHCPSCQAKSANNSIALPTTSAQRRNSTTGGGGGGGLKPIKLRNLTSNQVTFDVLHHNSKRPTACNETICLGSLMKTSKEFFFTNNNNNNNIANNNNNNQTLMAGQSNGQNVSPGNDQSRSKEQLLTEAYQFMEQYYASVKRLHTPAHRERLREIESEVHDRGTYELRQTELIFGAKLAWRNASRCIGRIQWSKLQVFDARGCTTARDMFDAICNQIKYATNRGNLRSAITVLPKRVNGREDFRIWNQQLISYAGYSDLESNGGLNGATTPAESELKCPVRGDPMNIEFTKICQKLGWKGTGSRWDILPIVVSAPGEDPQVFPLPEDLVVRVPLIHPKYDWFERLDLQWYALPAVSSMKFDVGGIEFPACPFSGWYMDTEVAVRDLCDITRYNLLPTIAQNLGLDTNSNASLWKDRAALEVTTAVLYSYQKANVTIVDHYTAAESFIKHLENENRLRGGCPADWVWIVPPMSGSLTPVFHQEMLNYELKPSYQYQEPAWKTHVWKNGHLEARNSIGGTPRKLRFKEIAKAVKFTSNLFGKALSKRLKATILYATETGRSEIFAKRLGQIFSHAFNVSVNCMDAYDTLHLEHETLLLIVTSTFGNGDPPENGEILAKQLQAIRMTGETAPDLDRESISVPVTYHYSVDLPSSSDGQLNGNGNTLTETTITTVNGTIGDGNDRRANSATPNSPNPTLGAEDSFAFADHVGPLSNVRFGVFALGSSAYPNFCAYGKYLDSVLAELGGERITPLATGDELCGQEVSFNEWACQAFFQACDVFCLTDELNMDDVMKRATLKPMLWSKENVRLEEVEHDEDFSKGTIRSTKRIEQALSKLSNNKKIMHYKMLERELLHEMDSTNSKEANLRQTIRVSLQTELNQSINDDGTHEDDGRSYYLPGDHLAIYPENDASLVEAIIHRLSTNQTFYADQPYLVKIRSQTSLDSINNGNNGLTFGNGQTSQNEQHWNAHDRLPACTLREALSRYLDLTSPPTQNFLRILAEEHSENKKDSDRLKNLAADSAAYESWKARNYPNLLEVLTEFEGVRPSLEFIFTQLPLMQPRYYSISSSPLSNSAIQLDLTIAVVQYVTVSGAPHNGVCSNFMKNVPIGDSVYGFIRSAPNFRLPKERDVPIIMVGPGTGIAPFRAFWEHRHKLKELNHGAEYGEMKLFFGCRYPSMQLYRREIEQMLKDGVISEYYVAYSRKSDEPKKYVQDNMRLASKKVHQVLMEQNGHIYVCGDVSMAEDVNKTLKAILQENGVQDVEMAIFSLKESQRYHEDIFGITLRTAEVTNKGRSNAMVKRSFSNS